MSSASELDPDALSAALLQRLAPQLTDVRRAQVPALTALLVALFSEQVPVPEAQPSALSALSNALAGAEITVSRASISFGSDADLALLDDQRHGLLHADGRLFRSALAAWARAQ